MTEYLPITPKSSYSSLTTLFEETGAFSFEDKYLVQKNKLEVLNLIEQDHDLGSFLIKLLKLSRN